MTVEDRLRTAMHAHDTDAPTRVPWPVSPDMASPPRRRATSRVLLAAAIVVVLAAAGTWLALAWPQPSRTATPAVSPTPRAPVVPLTCPTDWGGNPPAGDYPVPAAPTVPGAADRLVPTVTPGAVTVCGYVGGHALTGSRRVSSYLDYLVPALAYLPRGGSSQMCTQNIGPRDEDSYLVEFTYDDGTVWLTVPGHHCDGAGNGSFTTSVNLAADAAGLLETGTWVASPVGRDRDSNACPTATGRLGQDTAMVPGTPTLGAAICVFGVRTVAVSAARFDDLVSALNRLPTKPGGTSCVQARPDPGPSYVIVFSYAVGPGVLVEVDASCTPSVRNGSLTASATPELLSLLTRLVHG